MLNTSPIYIILLGIESYEDYRFTALPQAYDYIEKIERHFQTHLGLSVDQIKKYTDIDVETVEELENELDAIPNNAKLIFYFCGHAIAERSAYYLCLNQTSTKKLNNTAISFHKLVEQLQAKTQDVTILLDTAISDQHLQLLALPGVSVLASTSNSSSKIPLNETKFTETMLHVLATGVSTTSSSVLTWQEVANEIQDSLKENLYVYIQGENLEQAIFSNKSPGLKEQGIAEELIKLLPVLPFPLAKCADTVVTLLQGKEDKKSMLEKHYKDALQFLVHCLAANFKDSEVDLSKVSSNKVQNYVLFIEECLIQYKGKKQFFIKELESQSAEVLPALELVKKAWIGEEDLYKIADAVGQLLLALSFIQNYNFSALRSLSIYKKEGQLFYNQELARLNGLNIKQYENLVLTENVYTYQNQSSICLVQEEKILNLSPFYIDANLFEDSSTEIELSYVAQFDKRLNLYSLKEDKPLARDVENYKIYLRAHQIV